LRLLKYGSKSFAIWSKIDKAFSIILIKVYLISGYFLGDKYLYVELIESTWILVEFLLEIVNRIFLHIILFGEIVDERKGQHETKIPLVHLLDFIINILGCFAQPLPSISQTDFFLSIFLFVLFAIFLLFWKPKVIGTSKRVFVLS